MLTRTNHVVAKCSDRYFSTNKPLIRLLLWQIVVLPSSPDSASPAPANSGFGFSSGSSVQAVSSWPSGRRVFFVPERLCLAFDGAVRVSRSGCCCGGAFHYNSRLFWSIKPDTLSDQKNIKIFPRIRFEYFLILLKHCQFIIGNSSAGIREAPVYGIPTINIGSRQNNRAFSESVINVPENKG